VSAEEVRIPPEDPETAGDKNLLTTRGIRKYNVVRRNSVVGAVDLGGDVWLSEQRSWASVLASGSSSMLKRGVNVLSTAGRTEPYRQSA